MRHEAVDSVAAYVALACSLRREWSLSDRKYFDPWFRGHENHEWKLQPTVFRHGLNDIEPDIRAEFQRRSGHLLLEREPRTEWEWYFLMQHYRAPTRLLDWTDSALTALFFAIVALIPTETHIKQDAAVWVLDPWWLNTRVLGHQMILRPDFPEARWYLPDIYLHRLKRRYPVAIAPPHLARRVAVQRSYFTAHGNAADGFERLAAEPKARLVKITLPREAIYHMRLDLQTCGIHDTHLFPDLEGLSRELTRFFTDEWELTLPGVSRSKTPRAKK